MAWSGSVNVLQRKHEFRPGKRSKDLSKRHPVYPAGKTETETEELLMGVEKKRRLNVDQVNYLEASFSADLKLEPERKALLAKHLGICPRQVAIWFQNRRARWKTQQLEQDYESLKTRYDSVLKEKDRLLKEFDSAKDANKRLQAEVASLISSLQSTEKSDTMETREDQPCSGKSEVMSTSKSGNDQSEMQDSGQSYQTVPETGAFVTRTPHMEQPRSVCSAEIEPEVPILPSTNCNNGCVPLLVQHIIPKGYCPDSAYNVYCEWDNHFSGWGPL